MDPKVVTNWMVKDVCVDAANIPVPFDPYDPCPAGTTRRKIAATDPLPFHNIDQPGSQQSDSVIAYDAQGRAIFLSTFDFPPFNTFNLFAGSDGFDVSTASYIPEIDQTFINIFGTRDGGGYGQQFLGAGCEGAASSGWLLFPQTDFLAGGSAKSYITINYWEQSAQSFPGACSSSGYGTTTTAWAFLANASFGGVLQRPLKHMDAMVSYHGYCPHGCDMEVFWFTREYGKTMWQAWSLGPATPSPSCLHAGTVVYLGQNFTVADCRDWSAVQLVQSGPLAPLPWPLPQANLLAFSHFDPRGVYRDDCGAADWGVWCRTPSQSPEDPTYINWSVETSQFFLYPSFGTHQLAFLATNCGGACDPSHKFIYQDLPIARITNGGAYLFGVDARCQTDGCQGSLQLLLQVITSDDRVVAQSTARFDDIFYNNGNVTNQAPSEYYATAFFHQIATLSWTDAAAAKVRFSFAPLSLDTFHILDAFFCPFPTILNH